MGCLFQFKVYGLGFIKFRVAGTASGGFLFKGFLADFIRILQGGFCKGFTRGNIRVL